jgi:N-carbamoyl-L-amino-acid hydrolase
VGTTPMSLRKDALAAAACIISGVEQLGCQTPDAVSTVGRIAVEPNNSGVIPGQVVCTVDFCHRDSTALDGLVVGLQDLAAKTMDERGVDIKAEQIWRSDPTSFTPEIIDLVDDACATVGVDAMRLWSGAGHDAMYMSRLCPTGMIFIRSAGGLSHSEAEYSAPQDLEAGANVLLHAAIRLAQQL